MGARRYTLVLCLFTSSLAIAGDQCNWELLAKSGERTPVTRAFTPLPFGTPEVHVRQFDNFDLSAASYALEEFDHGFAIVTNDSGSAKHDLVVKDDISKGKPIVSAKLPMRPGENQVQIELVGPGKKAHSQFAVRVPGRVYQDGNVEMFLEGEGDAAIANQQLVAISDLVHEMNRYLKRPIVRMEIYDAPSPRGMALEGKPTISKSNFDQGRAESVTWHELAHVYFEERKNESPDFKQEWDRLFADALSRSTTSKAPIVSWKDIGAQSVMAVFNSGNYDGTNLANQHPQRNSGELFAYASQILKFHRPEWDRVVSRLTPRDQMLARQIADHVAGAYGEAR